MTDDDLIRRGDARKAVQYHVTDDDDRNTLSHAIADLPAVTVREAAMQELIDAYEDIMDYGIVFAKREQQDRLKAAKEKLK